jgi:hypothetical protein
MAACSTIITHLYSLFPTGLLFAFRYPHRASAVLLDLRFSTNKGSMIHTRKLGPTMVCRTALPVWVREIVGDLIMTVKDRLEGLLSLAWSLSLTYPRLGVVDLHVLQIKHQHSHWLAR